MHKLRTFSFLYFSTFALVGCGDNNINAVKESYTRFDNTLNLEQIFDHRKLCREVEWSEFKDDKGRSIVSYKCFLSGTQEYFEKLKSGHTKRAESRYEEAVTNAKRRYDRQYDSIEYYSKEVEKYQSEKVDLESEQSRIKSIHQEQLDTYAKYESLNVDGRFNKENWAEYKKELEQLDNKYPDVELSKIPYYLSRNENLLKSIDDKLWYAKEKLPDEVDIEDSYVESMNYAKSAKEEMIDKVKTKYNISDVYELYQWSFDKDGNPVFIYSGYEIVKSTGKEISQKVNFDTMFEYAYKNRVESIDNYFPVKYILANKLGLTN